MGIKPIYFDDEIKKPDVSNFYKSATKKEVSKEPVDTFETGMVMDFSLIQEDKVKLTDTTVDTSNTKKRGRKKTNGDPMMITETDRDLKDSETNIPYEEKYQETNNILRGAIMQLDAGLADMANDLNYIRASKTMKSKYTYMGNIQANMGSFISSKIMAARELNNTITKACELELRRTKELHLAEAQNDDKAILDTYNAFVSMPVGSNYNPLGPSPIELTVPSPNIIGADMRSSNEDIGYQNYIKNMTPTQHMMALESDPNVKQVVVYDQGTGARSFEIMNLATGEILQNVEKHDSMFLENTTIDLKNKIARNLDLNESYPLIVVGSSVLNEY